MSWKDNETILGFISHTLMDEDDDLENKSYMLRDSFTLEVTERSLYEAIACNPHQESTDYTIFQPPIASHHHHHFLGLDSSQQNLYQEDDHLAEHHHSNRKLANNKAKKKKLSKGKKRDTNEVAKESVDLRSLLMQCAEAMSDSDSEQVNCLILQIRRHSSPHGSAAERVSHYFVNALEARLAGMGTALLASINPVRISGEEILKGNRMLVKAVPFLTMAYLLANGTVMEKLAKKGATLGSCWDSNGFHSSWLIPYIYRLQNVMEQPDMGSTNIPRDDLLNLIRRINPEMFVHGVVSGAYNAPFFLARFREAFYSFLSLFDMFEATVPPEEEEDQSARVGFEEHCLGRSVTSVVACEGTDRVDRPETYKQWQCRTVRAGFRQISLDKEIVKPVRGMIKTDYHHG